MRLAVQYERTQGRKETPLFAAVVESQFLGCPTRILVAVLTELSAEEYEVSPGGVAST